MYYECVFVQEQCPCEITGRESPLKGMVYFLSFIFILTLQQYGKRTESCLFNGQVGHVRSPQKISYYNQQQMMSLCHYCACNRTAAYVLQYFFTRMHNAPQLCWVNKTKTITTAVGWTVAPFPLQQIPLLIISSMYISVILLINFFSQEKLTLYDCRRNTYILRSAKRLIFTCLCNRLSWGMLVSG